jgi:RNA polymerase sigma factor (sigma-70 family)
MLNRIFLSNKEVIKRIRENDRTILGELFIANEHAIHSYIKRNGGSSSDAQDLLQEAIIVLWQNVNAGHFELSAKVSTYLFAVAKNKWMAESRRRKKYDHSMISIEQKTDGSNSLSEMISNEEKRIVTDALEQLESPCKELLLLFYFEERKMADIAKILKFANSDVAKAKKYQCKKALEKLLQNKLK